MKINELTAPDLSLAYSRQFTLIADIYHRGPTAENLDSIQAIPALADGLTVPINWDTAAADHHHLFRFNVFAYESTFYNSSGLLGGPLANENLRIYRDCAFQSQLLTETSDHISNQLGFLAYLSKAQVQDTPQRVNWAVDQSAYFIDNHLFNWLAPFTLALRQHGNRFYGSLVNLTLESIGGYRLSLGKQEQSVSQLPPPPTLDTATSSPKELANYLLTPVYSGIYIGRDDIAATASRLSLPRGFGQRKQMLLNLIQSALIYDQTNNFIDDLRQIVLRWEADYNELADQLGPMLKIPFWLGRLQRTKELLEELGNGMGV